MPWPRATNMTAVGVLVKEGLNSSGYTNLGECESDHVPVSSTCSSLELLSDSAHPYPLPGLYIPLSQATAYH